MNTQSCGFPKSLVQDCNHGNDHGYPIIATFLRSYRYFHSDHSIPLVLRRMVTDLDVLADQPSYLLPLGLALAAARHRTEMIRPSGRSRAKSPPHHSTKCRARSISTFRAIDSTQYGPRCLAAVYNGGGLVPTQASKLTRIPAPGW
jgi:hypothetical protein